MAVTAKWFGTPIKNFMSGANVFDFDTDEFKVALCTSTYTPNQDTHDFFNDVTNEITGTGYTAGGKKLETLSVTYDSATNESRFDAADTSWTGATFTARYAIVYKNTGSAATSPLVCWIDFGENQTISAGTFTITWDATGIAKIKAE